VVLFLGAILFADSVLFLLATPKCVPLEGPIHMIEACLPGGTAGREDRPSSEGCQTGSNIPPYICHDVCKL